jgi:uncharacterized protein
MDRFEWYPAKNAANIKKHGISFEEAATIFNGPMLSGRDDSAGEPREKSFGLIGGLVVVCVIHTDRDDRIRIISARKATANERKLFDAYLKKAIS